ncbi:gastrula zinc finger protein XlCGF26.1-like isoform X2 [Planococcus citri]
MKIVRAFEFRQQAKRSDEILRRYVQDKEYKQKQENAEKQLQQVLLNNKNGDLSNEVVAEELEVEPLTYCVKVEPEDDEDENSNLMGSEDCSEEGNAEQNIVADVDPLNMEDDDSEEDQDQMQNRPMLGQEFEPVWMNNGNEENENSENSSQWICQYCNSSFPTEEKFNRHALIHTSEPPFPCDYCEESFELRTDLKAHWRVHSDGNPHICQMCGKSFPDRMSYLKHSDLHDQVKPFRCPVCQKSFCYGSDLRKHAITHTGVRPYVCSVCGNSFTRSTSLNKHLRMHNGNRPFSCSACPKIFGSRGDLKRHQIIHSGIKPWICTVCSVPFNRKDKLVRHEKLHSGEPRPFQCYECPTSFSRKEDLTKHIQFHHYKPPPNMETSATNNTEEEAIENSALDQISKSDLERGNRTFRALIREAFSGTQTNGWNPAPTTVNVINTAVVEPKPENIFKCDICHKKFSQKHSLDSHKKIHTAVKPYGCSMCEKSFYRRRELTRHEAVHTGYKPFSCGVCGKCFSRTDKLNRHVQTHQYKSVFRNHKCEACSLNFRTEQELLKHKPLCKPEIKDDEFYPEVIVKSEENDDDAQMENKPIDISNFKITKKNKELDSRETLTKLNKNPEILLLPII